MNNTRSFVQIITNKKPKSVYYKIGILFEPIYILYQVVCLPPKHQIVELSNPLKKDEKILPVINLSDSQFIDDDRWLFSGDYFSAR